MYPTGPISEKIESFGFDLAPTGLTVTRDRRIARCNQRFCEMFGYTRTQLEGQLLSMLYPSNKEFIEIGIPARQRMQETGRYNDERIMMRSDGSLFWVRARGQALDPARPFAKCVWSFADISESRPLVELTRRERQVAMQLLQGMTTKDIAQSLDLSPRTIEVYRGNLLRKFEARNGTELMAKLSGVPA